MTWTDHFPTTKPFKDKIFTPNNSTLCVFISLEREKTLVEIIRDVFHNT